MSACKVCGEVLVDGFCPGCGWAEDGSSPIYCAMGGTASGVVGVEEVDCEWPTFDHRSKNVALAYVNDEPCIVKNDGTVLAILDCGIARRVLAEYVRSLNYIVNWEKLSNTEVKVNVIGLGEDIDSEFDETNFGLEFFE